MSSLIGAFILGAALLFNEGKYWHARGYLLAAGLLFACSLAGAQ